MSMDPRILDLLEQWEDQRAQGQAPTPEELCANCPELLEDLRGRIRRLEDLGSLIGTDQGVADLASGLDQGMGELPGAWVGASPAERYQPLRFHAKGGLGEVFVAEDAELHRQVALKRVQAHRADDPESRRRFLLEAEITGKLEHPGVVPVYGLGTDANGQPCYAMRFIQGETLQDAMKRFHETEKKPGRDPGAHRLEFRGLLNRFVAVCNTIAYAHSRGVLHRDLKPGNIMLGKYGETLVVDWGLAKPFARSEEDRTGGEDTLLPSPDTGGSGTQTGQAMGTPAYMSPEQAAGQWQEVGPASDVYSLGATLYALLTGQASFPGPWDLERVKEAKFPPPRQVRKEVPRPLEAVCLKAMARKPAERYNSAGQLGEEIEHWLADEPVTAYREPLLARLGRWGRHHRTAVVGVGAGLTAAVIFLAVLAGVIEQGRRRSIAEQQRTEEARRKTRAALDEVGSEAIDTLLTQQKELTPAHKKFLRKMLALYEEFAQETGASPETRAEVANAHFRMGNIRYRLGEHQEAEAAYGRARELYARLATDFPAVLRYRQNLANSHNSLGILLQTTGRPQEAERTYQDALAIQEQLAADFPSMPQYRQDLAHSHNNLGNLLADTGRPQDAEKAYGNALAIFKQLTADFPSVPQHRQELATSQNNLGNLLAITGRPQDAEKPYRDALAIRKQLAADFPSVPQYRQELAQTHFNLGVLLATTGRPQDAEAAYRDALAIQKQLAADFPTVSDYQNDLARTMGNLADLLQARQQFAQARELLDQAEPHLQAALKANPKNPTYRQSFWHNRFLLTKTLAGLGEQAGALKTAEELAQFDKNPAVGAYDTACTLSLCIPLAQKNGKLSAAQRQEQAQAYADQAMTLLRQAVAKGYRNAAHMKQDKDLDPLRQRDDFKKLLEELEKPNAGSK